MHDTFWHVLLGIAIGIGAVVIAVIVAAWLVSRADEKDEQ